MKTSFFRELSESHTRNMTPFEVVRDDHFNEIIDDNLKFLKSIDDVMRFAMLNQTVVKPHSIVNFSTKYKKRRYNSKCLENLVQNQDKKVVEKINEIRNQKNIENVNNWTASFLHEYQKEKGKEYKGLPSKQVASKLYKITSVFVRSVLSGFVSTRGFRQRSVSFCTFTITEAQKHSDTEIIKTFVDFLDHLKKVNNYVIDPVTKKQTREKALILDNYVWRAETQENGNIHFHLLADTFLNQHMLRRVWNNYLQNLGYKFGYGAANVNSLKRDKNNNKILNVERYLCKYMTKPPLRNVYKHLKPKDLAGVPDVDKYRRPIIGKFWGCSRRLTKLEYPKFYNKRAKEVVNMMKNKMKEYKSDTLPSYISVYVGDTRKVFSKLGYDVQRELKEHYMMCYHWLYDEIPIDVGDEFSLN